MPLCQVIDLINPSYRSIAHNLDYNLLFFLEVISKTEIMFECGNQIDEINISFIDQS